MVELPPFVGGGQDRAGHGLRLLSNGGRFYYVEVLPSTVESRCVLRGRVADSSLL